MIYSSLNPRAALRRPYFQSLDPGLENPHRRALFPVGISPDDFRTGVNTGAFPAFLQDRREVRKATGSSRLEAVAQRADEKGSQLRSSGDHSLIVVARE
jgi:hypothetical protein